MPAPDAQASISTVPASVPTVSGRMAPQAAAAWLEDNLTEASVSQWAQWADARLALHQADLVVARLEPLLNAAADVDDGRGVIGSRGAAG